MKFDRGEVALRAELRRRRAQAADAREDHDLAEQAEPEPDRDDPAHVEATRHVRADARRALGEPARDGQRVARQREQEEQRRRQHRATHGRLEAPRHPRVDVQRDLLAGDRVDRLQRRGEVVVVLADELAGRQRQLQRPHDEVEEHRQRQHAQRREQLVVARGPDQQRQRRGPEDGQQHPMRALRDRVARQRRDRKPARDRDQQRPAAEHEGLAIWRRRHRWEVTPGRPRLSGPRQ